MRIYRHVSICKIRVYYICCRFFLFFKLFLSVNLFQPVAVLDTHFFLLPSLFILYRPFLCCRIYPRIIVFKPLLHSTSSYLTQINLYHLYVLHFFGHECFGCNCFGRNCFGGLHAHEAFRFALRGRSNFSIRRLF